MAGITKDLTLLALTVACLSGCETTHVAQEHWTYSGRDEALRAPPRVPRGELSASALDGGEAGEGSRMVAGARAGHRAREGRLCARNRGEQGSGLLDGL